MQEILSFLHKRSVNGLLAYTDQVEAADRYSLSLPAVEELSLANEILPARYKRNQKIISTRQQLTLCKSTVAVIGCGGLGGYIIEGLARLGIGRIIAVDPDIFVEHNLNRQLLCTLDMLGEKKVNGAFKRAAQINPAVQLHPVDEAFTSDNGPALLKDADIAADALDSIPDRLALAGVCEQLKIPLVHGAIAGWYGNVASQFPGEKTVQKIYERGNAEKGVETNLGNPSFTPAVIAGFEIAEIVKILLKTGIPLRNSCLNLDLYHAEVNKITLEMDEQGYDEY